MGQEQQEVEAEVIGEAIQVRDTAGLRDLQEHCRVLHLAAAAVLHPSVARTPCPEFLVRRGVRRGCGERQNKREVWEGSKYN